MALASMEIRFPLYRKLRAAVFLDAGQVWAQHTSPRPGELEAAAGPGLMIDTPVGPVRVDLGINLTERPADEPGWVLHLAIGHPF